MTYVLLEGNVARPVSETELLERIKAGVNRCEVIKVLRLDRG